MKSKQDASQSQSSSDRQKWQRVFDALVGIINKQQSQLQTLLSERKLLEDRIRTGHKLYDSDVAFLRERISQMKGALAVQYMMCSLDARKLDLVVGLKQREGLLHKLKLDEAELALADFKECFDVLSAKCPEPKDSGETPPEIRRSKRRCGERGQKSAEELLPPDHSHEVEIERLKQQFDALISEKNNEVSTLMAEKKFVWNQYKLLETNLNDKLKSQETEIQLAKEKISGLLACMEKLQASNRDNDEAIVELKCKIADKEDLARKRGDEIVRLTQELELLRRTGCSSDMPVLNWCTPSGSTASSRNRKISSANMSKQLTAAQVTNSTKSEKVSKGLRRKSSGIDSGQVTPKLFSSAFRVPKLKTPAKQMR
ncbi:hypothetical protein SAY86_011375 [Trapa natans]|uniref:Uncharacterized protein n=1 Tax=Trapa natans TaxID=22666 RepID=A0AAN7LIV8_TRANT|nr:hypothetical protein SAY86_011375 [Trapa natans]